MHNQIRKFYDKWGRFWRGKISLKSLPTREDPRYQTPFQPETSQSENYRLNWRADDPDYIEGDEEWTGA